jgi:DNA-binding response OmpR family regulator
MKNMGSSQAGEPGNTPAEHGINRPPKRILVVDDDSDIRRLNAEVLTASGYRVDAVEDGAAGWEALNASSYDLLITDNNMPRVTGMELIKKVQSARMALPVILASGATRAEAAEMHLAATLPKPFTLDELLGTVKKVLGEAEGTSMQIEFLPSLWQNQPPADGLRT